MTMPTRQNLIEHLRDLDEHMARIEPDSAFEARLRVRLQAAAEKKSSPNTTITWLRTYARPIAVAFVASFVLLLSLSDKPPAARSGLVLPNVPDAYVDPVEPPTGEPFEPSKTRRDETPETLTSPSEVREPAPRNVHPEPYPVFPVQPDDNALPERNFIDRRNIRRDLMPVPSSNAPKSSSRERSDGFGFWSPTQPIPVDSQPRPGVTSGNWSFGGATRTKLPHASPPPKPRSACAMPETWKERAMLDCDEIGMILSNIEYLFPCGDGLFRDEEHECAEGPADEETCTTDTITHGGACMEPELLKMVAHEKCKSAVKDLVDLTYFTEGCGWKVRKATYTCCPFVSEPPPVCQIVGMGDGVTCMDLGSLKQEASVLCNKLGQTLTDIQHVTNGSCPDYHAVKAEITCCKD